MVKLQKYYQTTENWVLDKYVFHFSKEVKEWTVNGRMNGWKEGGKWLEKQEDKAKMDFFLLQSLISK